MSFEGDLGSSGILLPCCACRGSITCLEFWPTEGEDGTLKQHLQMSEQSDFHQC